MVRNGIAVGMATSIPPHNLGELCAATIALIENPNTRDATLLKFVKGPDFPTGGIIVEEPEAMAEAYKTGRGSSASAPDGTKKTARAACIRSWSRRCPIKSRRPN